MTDEEKLRICRRCLLLQSGKEDILSDIKNRIGRIPPDKKANDGIYNARLAACAACEQLVSGTCLKCGCYPEFRAAFAKNDCPEKKWRDITA